MKSKKGYLHIFQFLLLIVGFLILPGNSFSQDQIKLPKWAFGPFIRPHNVNPLLTPDKNTLFTDPMTNKKLAWEANYVFNPAAAIKGNKIYVLYRAEDNTGTGIGTRTSRIGLA